MQVVGRDRRPCPFAADGSDAAEIEELAALVAHLETCEFAKRELAAA